MAPEATGTRRLRRLLFLALSTARGLGAFRLEGI